MTTFKLSSFDALSRIFQLLERGSSKIEACSAEIKVIYKEDKNPMINHIRIILEQYGFISFRTITDSKKDKPKIRHKMIIENCDENSEKLLKLLPKITAEIVLLYSEANPRLALDGRPWNNGLRVDQYR